jgi:hypothetical protein
MAAAIGAKTAPTLAQAVSASAAQSASPVLSMSFLWLPRSSGVAVSEAGKRARLWKVLEKSIGRMAWERLSNDLIPQF